MRLSIAMGTPHWLLMAGIAVGAVAAQAAGGFTITHPAPTARW